VSSKNASPMRARGASRFAIAHPILRGLPAALLALALVGAWELYVELGSVSPIVLPAPHEVAREAWNNAGLLGANLELTAQEVGLGVLLALGLGFRARGADTPLTEATPRGVPAGGGLAGGAGGVDRGYCSCSGGALGCCRSWG